MEFFLDSAVVKRNCTLWVDLTWRKEGSTSSETEFTHKKETFCTKIMNQIHTKCWTPLILGLWDTGLYSSPHEPEIIKESSHTWTTILDRKSLSTISSLNTKPSPSQRIASFFDKMLNCCLTYISKCIQIQKITMCYIYTECPFYLVPGDGRCRGISPTNTGVLCDNTVMLRNTIKGTPLLI
jgi:hypothetical protein